MMSAACRFRVRPAGPWLALGLLLSAAAAARQPEPPEPMERRWLRAEAPGIRFYSQAPARRTERFAARLAAWRQVAAWVVQDRAPFPPDGIPLHVYLFEDGDAFRRFAVGDEPAVFRATPRANFMALTVGDERSEMDALHHYAHFLTRNFLDLRLPRWYEEGLAGYLARARIRDGRAGFERSRRGAYESIAALSETLSMERLLYRDDALASPRVIQIANLKSEALFHYFRHGHEDAAFPDRRGQLAAYLGLLLDGRNPRFAFDLAFDLTARELDGEFHRWLLAGERPPGEIAHGELVPPPPVDARRMPPAELAVQLGELALNSGRFEEAQRYFQAAIDLDGGIARGHSGLGDALRIQELDGMDQEIARLFAHAVSLAPDDPDILMDYGEYWEAELLDCGKTWPDVRRRLIVEEVRDHFERALALAPDNAEANLAMGQLHLLEGGDWREGRPFQRRAFELLPADSFIMEQAVRYAIEAGEHEEAERLIGEMAQPVHFFGEPEYVTALRVRLMRKRRGEDHDACAEH